MALFRRDPVDALYSALRSSKGQPVRHRGELVSWAWVPRFAPTGPAELTIRFTHVSSAGLPPGQRRGLSLRGVDAEITWGAEVDARQGPYLWAVEGAVHTVVLTPDGGEPGVRVMNLYGEPGRAFTDKPGMVVESSSDAAATLRCSQRPDADGLDFDDLHVEVTLRPLADADAGAAGAAGAAAPTSTAVSAEDEPPAALPVPRLHPGALADGAWARSPETCTVCGRTRGWVYDGPVFSETADDVAICPWCVVDGSAARHWDATFTDLLDRGPTMPPEDADEVLRRTPGYRPLQNPLWPTLDGRAGVFTGYVGAAEAQALDPAAVAAVDAALTDRMELPAEVTRGWLNRDDGPTAYLFKGLAGRWWAHVDDDRYDDLPAAGYGIPSTDGPPPEPSDPLRRSVLRIALSGPAKLRVLFPPHAAPAVRGGLGLCPDAGMLLAGGTTLRVLELWPDTAPPDSTVAVVPPGEGPVELAVWGCEEADGGIVAPTALTVEERGRGWRLRAGDLEVELSLS